MSAPPDRRGGEPLHRVEYQDGAVRGYRWWRVSPSVRQGVVLRSMHFQTVWAETMRAECLSDSTGQPRKGLFKPRGKHVAPDVKCRCGLYAQNPDFPLLGWFYKAKGHLVASGSIAMSGRVLVCERGFKASVAVIESPVIIEASCICDRPAEFVLVPNGEGTVEACCEVHRPPVHGVPIGEYVRKVLPVLSANYPNIEFLSPLVMEEVNDV